MNINNEFHRDFLVQDQKYNIILHTSYDNISNFNKYAKKSLEIKNESNKNSNDEALSIHIITEKLNTRLCILYEKQINEFYGKPDFIIKLGKKLYIMVSTTRAISKNTNFSQNESDRLIYKKIKGLLLYSNNLECFIDDIIDDYINIPILHILTTSHQHAEKCIKSYQRLLSSKKIDVCKIKIIISVIINYTNIL